MTTVLFRVLGIVLQGLRVSSYKAVKCLGFGGLVRDEAPRKDCKKPQSCNKKYLGDEGCDKGCSWARKCLGCCVAFAEGRVGGLMFKVVLISWAVCQRSPTFSGIYLISEVANQPGARLRIHKRTPTRC